MLSQTLLVGAFAAFAAAQSTVLTFTHVPNPVTDGHPQAITYATNDTSSPVTIILRQGESSNLQTIETLTTTATGGQFIWTPSTSLPDGIDYALEIKQGNQVNYFGPFQVQGASASSSTSSSSSSGTTGVVGHSSSSSMTNSSMSSTSSIGTMSSGNSTTMARNTTMSSATLSSTRSAKSSPATNTATTTSSGSAATAASSAASASSSSGASPIQMSGAFSILLGAAAAVFYL